MICCCTAAREAMKWRHYTEEYWPEEGDLWWEESLSLFDMKFLVVERHGAQSRVVVTKYAYEDRRVRAMCWRDARRGLQHFLEQHRQQQLGS